jgi:hypothetical protein
MSAIGIGLAWAAMAAAAFMALSAVAPARTRRELEADPLAGVDAETHARVHGSRSRRREHATDAYAHWPQATHLTASLRSSPSVTHMQVSPPLRSGPLGLH